MTMSTSTTTQQDANGSSDNVVLSVKDLRVHYDTPTGDVIAVNGVNFDVYEARLSAWLANQAAVKRQRPWAYSGWFSPPDVLSTEKLSLMVPTSSR